MILNLTEVVNLKVAMTRTLGNLQTERQNIMFETVDQAPTSIQVNPRIMEITQEIREIVMNLARLESILSYENSVVHPGYDKTILECISYIKRMRGELSQYQSMAMSQLQTYNVSRWEGATGHKVAKFDPAEWKKMAIDLEKQINSLSRELDRRNFSIEVDVPFAELYM